MDLYSGIGLAFILLNFGRFKAVLALLDDHVMKGISLQDISVAFAFLDKLNPTTLTNDNSCLEDNDLNARIDIANRFIEYGILVNEFLQLKCNCFKLLHNIDNLLSCAKDLFKKSKSAYAAALLVSVYKEDENISRDELLECVDVLNESNDPIFVIGAAFACIFLGDFNKADFLAYKSLFLDKGINNTNLLINWFSYFCKTNHLHKEKKSSCEVNGSCVVCLELKGSFSCNRENSELSDVKWLCLDSESELFNLESSRDNHCLDMIHIYPHDPLYVLLKGNKVGYEFNYKGNSYLISEILNRDFKVREYFLKIICDILPVGAPDDKFNGLYLLTVDPDNPEKIAQDICKIAYKQVKENEDEFKRRFKIYKHDKIGIPIEILGLRGYDNYLNIIKFLLDNPLEQLNAFGLNNYSIRPPFIVSLSSLSVMGALDMLWILRELGHEVKITKSLKSFVKILFESQKKHQKESPCSFVAVSENDFFINKEDPSILKIWQEIYVCCCELDEVEVTTQERNTFLSKELFSLLVNKWGINICQIDTIIAAKKCGGFPIFDDRFFRIVSEGYFNVHSGNTNSLLEKISVTGKATALKEKLISKGYKGSAK